MQKFLRLSVPRQLLVVVFLGLSSTAGCSDNSQPKSNQTHSDHLPSATSSVPRDSTQIILVADVWPPFNCATEDSNEGYIVDVAREIFEPLGYSVDYRIVPWKRALAGTLEGAYDGAIATSLAEGPDLIKTEQALLLNSVSFFVRAGDSWRFTGESSLETVRLGVVNGYDYVDWLNSYIARNSSNPERVQGITGQNPLVQNLKKLVHGHIDVLVGNRNTIQYGARLEGLLDRIGFAGQDQMESYSYLGFSPNTPNGKYLASLFDREFIQLRAEGRFSEILSRYGMTDWNPIIERVNFK